MGKMTGVVLAFVKFAAICSLPVLAVIGDTVVHLKPIFEPTSTNISAIAGETIHLPCSVENKGDYKLIWLNPRVTVISTDDSRYIDDPRISVERPKIRDWNLMIREVRHNDSGEYMCQINTHPVLIKRIYLSVKVPPEIIEDWTNMNIQVVEGSKVEMVCNATGVPLPMVTWYRQANSIVDYSQPDYEDRTLVGEVLVLPSITRYCDGLYECNAENGVPPVASKAFEITVLFPPEVRLPTKKMGQVLGRETILQCKVAASPHASIVWRKNGVDIPPHYVHKYRMEIYDEENYEKTVNLNIINIEKGDFGNYTCEASNAYGLDSESMLLYQYTLVTHKPVRTTPRWSQNTARPPSQTSYPYNRKHFTTHPAGVHYSWSNGAQEQRMQFHKLIYIVILLWLRGC